MAPRNEEQFEEMREKSRDKIITAALKLFANNGFHNTSMSKVAQEAGISKGLIYNYFPSKDELLKGVFELGLKNTEQLFQDHQEQDPQERFRGMLEDVFAWVAANKEYYHLMTNLVLHPGEIESIKPFLDAAGENKIQQFVPLFENMGYEDPYAEAMWCGAILDGIMMGWFVMGDKYPLETMKQRVIDKYCNNK